MRHGERGDEPRERPKSHEASPGGRIENQLCMSGYPSDFFLVETRPVGRGSFVGKAEADPKKIDNTMRDV